jgi:hypothetical protein
LRSLSLAVPRQLSLEVEADGSVAGRDRWSLLPDAARTQVLALLARLIARGVLADEEPAG